MFLYVTFMVCAAVDVEALKQGMQLLLAQWELLHSLMYIHRDSLATLSELLCTLWPLNS